jgi:hypothetical protein
MPATTLDNQLQKFSSDTVNDVKWNFALIVDVDPGLERRSHAVFRGECERQRYFQAALFAGMELEFAKLSAR